MEELGGQVGVGRDGTVEEESVVGVQDGVEDGRVHQIVPVSLLQVGEQDGVAADEQVTQTAVIQPHQPIVHLFDHPHYLLLSH